MAEEGTRLDLGLWMGLTRLGLMTWEKGLRVVLFLWGDFNFCVRPKEERCILCKILNFMCYTIYYNLPDEFIGTA